MYIPDIIPKEDAEIFNKYHGGAPGSVGFGNKPAVLVVDMLNGFVLDDYPTGYSNGD